jgi:23S rRNA (adenine2503-C2)-methyltransferase
MVSAREPEAMTTVAETKPAEKSQLPSLLDLGREELTAAVVRLGEPRYRADQLWRAVYNECAASFDGMTALSKAFRARLKEEYSLSPMQPLVRLRSKDGSTDKVLLRLHDGELIETVLMRYEPDGHRKRRRTACVSTQAGCALGCTFCATGQQGFTRQLSPGEIVGQVLWASRLAHDEDSGLIKAGEITQGDAAGLTNVVFMGMGEPFANYANVMAAIRVINDGQGLNIGARHITVSTVGLVPQILKFASEPLQLNLAVSLHAPDDATRSETMPVNRRYPVTQLLDACRTYVEKTNRRVFFEYVLLRGQNDSTDHAHRLGALLKGLLCHVNLIPVNPTQDGPYGRPDRLRADAFQAALLTHGVPSTVRTEKGIDINAGCGQLRARALAADGAPAE